MRRKHLVPCMLVLLASPLAARVPELRVEDGSGSTALELLETHVRVTLEGAAARTEHTLVYRNHTAGDLEGDFYFPLPPGASVTDVALEIGGQLRHASVVERERARAAYDEVVHRRVDPALAEWTGHSAFRLGVYPIPARGEKKVVISVDEDVGARYRLDLRYGARLRRASVHVDAGEGWRPAGTLPLTPEAGGWRAELQDRVLDSELVLERSGPAQAVGATEPASGGGHFVSAALPLQPPPAVPWPPARSVLLLWDASGSAAAQDRARLLELLAAFLGRQSPELELTLVPFHVRTEPPRRVAAAATAAGFRALAEELADIVPAGAADLVGLFRGLEALLRRLPRDTRIVLVTDGLDSLSSRSAISEALESLGGLRRPLLVLNAAEARDEVRLRRIAEVTRGWFLDLAGPASPVRMAEQAMDAPARLQVRCRSGRVHDLRPASVLLAGGEDMLLLTGRSGRAAGRVELELEWQAGGELVRQSAALELRPVRQPAGIVRTAWARARLAELLAAPAGRDGELLALGKEHKLLTPRTSLLVLEDWMDYVEHGIEMPPEVQAQFEEAERQRHEDEVARQRERERQEGLAGGRLLPQHPAVRGPLQADAARRGWLVLGRVQDTEGAPLPGVRVHLETESPRRQRTASTAPDGSFWFALERRMPFEVHATLPGFGDAALSVREPPESGARVLLTMLFDGMMAEMTVIGDAAPAAAPEALLGPPPRNPFRARPPDEAAASGLLVPAAVLRFGLLHPWTTLRRLAGPCGPWPWKGGASESRELALDAIVSALAEGPGRSAELYAAGRLRARRSKEYLVRAAAALRGAEPELAVRALTDLLELRPDEPGTARIVARLLSSWGERELAGRLLQRVLEQWPSSPRALRELALLRAAEGRLQEALGHLVRARELTEEWDGFAALLKLETRRLRRLLRRPGPPAGVELEAAVGTGLTVVMAWDTSDSDVDLHVTEPSGETVGYSRPGSAAGGRLLEDMRNGSGPEVYSIRTPPAGRYRVEVRYYEADDVDVDASTLVLISVLRRDAAGALQREEVPFVLRHEQQRVVAADLTLP
jgi:Ca-activated chloride channel homolog